MFGFAAAFASVCSDRFEEALTQAGTPPIRLLSLKRCARRFTSRTGMSSPMPKQFSQWGPASWQPCSAARRKPPRLSKFCASSFAVAPINPQTSLRLQQSLFTIAVIFFCPQKHDQIGQDFRFPRNSALYLRLSITAFQNHYPLSGRNSAAEASTDFWHKPPFSVKFPVRFRRDNLSFLAKWSVATPHMVNRVESPLAGVPSHTASPQSGGAFGHAVRHPAVSEL